MQSTFRLPNDLIEYLPGPDQSSRVWVVGGALRDHLLGHTYEDIDFAVRGDAIELARKLANAWSWDFFILDAERGSARILPKDPQAALRRMDFSQIRGEDIETDLHHRDFTINALAIDVHVTSKLIDPTGGLADLREKRLRACGPESLRQDPVRVIRAVRFATEFGLKIDKKTIDQIKRSTEVLQDVSIERTRDELFRILNGTHVGAAISLLDHLGALEAVFPDILQLKLSANGGTGEATSWQLVQAQIRRLSELVHILEPEHDAEAAADAIQGSVSLRLGRYREPLSAYLTSCLVDERSIKGLIYFLLLRVPHNPAGNFELREAGSIRSSQENAVRNEVIERAQAFRLSRMECEYLGNAGAAYRLLRSALDPHNWTDLQYHRFYRAFSKGGLGAVLLYLSHVAARTTGPPDTELWERSLSIARGLWEAYFERYQEIVEPDPLLNGSDLINELGIESGPRIGKLLRAITEAQVSGEVRSRQDALALAAKLLSTKDI